MRALLAGWFSFEQMGATAGDIQARDLAGCWLSDAGFDFDIATAPPFSGGVDWRMADPTTYSLVLFVCGPFGNGPPVTEFIARFAGRRFVGLDLSMLDPVDSWNPFDFLLERDSSRTARPDIAFAMPTPHPPVAGLVLVHPQPEYRARGRDQLANAVLRRLADSREMATVNIDTRLDTNNSGLRSAAEVESLIARMDVILTTRLHGLVLGLKNAVPVLAIDPVSGGQKVRRQAQTVGWPLVFDVDNLDDTALQQALDYCLTENARKATYACRATARQQIEVVRHDFMTWITGS